MTYCADQCFIGSEKAGERATFDDTPPLAVIIEGVYCTYGPDKLISRRWEVSKGNDQQLAIRPESFVPQVVHVYATHFACEDKPVNLILAEELGWDQKE